MRAGHAPGQAADTGGGLVGAQRRRLKFTTVYLTVHLFILPYVSTLNSTTVYL